MENYISPKALQCNIREAIKETEHLSVSRVAKKYGLQVSTINRILGIKDSERKIGEGRIAVQDWATKHNLTKHKAIYYLERNESNITVEQEKFGRKMYCDDIEYVSDTEGLYNAKEFAEMKGLRPDNFAYYVKLMKLPFVNINGKRYFDKNLKVNVNGK
jgi:hypothetical protein